MKPQNAVDDIFELARMVGEADVDPMLFEARMPQTLPEAKAYIALACAILYTATEGKPVGLGFAVETVTYLGPDEQPVHSPTPPKPGAHPHAYALLGEFAASRPVREFLARLSAMQLESEAGDWWDTDLGNAIGEVWGHLKIAVERAERP